MHLSYGVCRLRARVPLKTLSSLLKEVKLLISYQSWQIDIMYNDIMRARNFTAKRYFENAFSLRNCSSFAKTRLGVRFLNKCRNTPNANMADHSVVARDERPERARLVSLRCFVLKILPQKTLSLSSICSVLFRRAYELLCSECEEKG